MWVVPQKLTFFRITPPAALQCFGGVFFAPNGSKKTASFGQNYLMFSKNVLMFYTKLPEVFEKLLDVFVKCPEKTKFSTKTHK